MNRLDTEVTRRSRSEKILECSRQLEKLQAELRREFLLASIEFEPLRVWQSLSSEELKDREFVYKFLSTGGTVFGENPWDEKDVRSCRLPPEFLSDPDAVIVFVSSDKFRKRHRHGSTFLPPKSLRDHKEVMKAVCSCIPRALRVASPRLQDDEDTVRAALICAENFSAVSCFRYASGRLRRNVKLICDLIPVGDSMLTTWLLYHASLSDLDIDELKQIAAAAPDAASREGKENRELFFLELFPPILRDIKEVMLDFFKCDWRSLKWCGEHIRCDADVVQVAASQNPNAFQYALGEVRRAYEEKRTVNSVIEELENGLSFVHVPVGMRLNREVILAGVKAGKNIECIGFGELDELLRDKKFVLSYIDAHGMFSEADCLWLANNFPSVLQNDEEIGLAFLRTGYYFYEEILDAIPSLWGSREAMIGTTKIQRENCKYSKEFVNKCDFWDDEEFLLAACENDEDNLEYASERLISDYDVLLAVSTMSSTTGMYIKYATPEFQVNNPNLVVKAIEVLPFHVQDSSLFASLDPDVWRHRPVVLAWLKTGRSLFVRLREIFDGDNLPFCDDPEVMRLSTSTCPYAISAYASRSLRDDRTFVFSLVRENWKCLRFLPVVLQRDDEILTAAVALSGGGILCDCFGFRTASDFSEDSCYLIQFTGRVRAKLERHDSFVNEFLRGISICDQSHIPPAKRCLLPRLNRGAETSTAWKRLIAQFAGVPIGTEVKELRAASANLAKFGF